MRACSPMVAAAILLAVVAAAIPPTALTPAAAMPIASSVWDFSNVTGYPGWTNYAFSSGDLETAVTNAALGTQTLYPWYGWAIPRPGHEKIPCVSKIPRFGNTSCVTLDPNYDAAWTTLWGNLKPYADNGTLAGIFLGDERIWDGASLANVSSLSTRIRQDWPDAIIYINDAQDVYMCNFNRLGEPIFAEGECFPEEVDWMGFDYYGWGDNTSFLYSQAAFTQNLFPRIWDHQRVVPVTECTAPGAPGPANWTMDQYDKECARNAMQFFEWALAEPRVAGIFPWHWDTEADPTAPEGTGLVDLPHCRATYEGIGEIIVNAIADLGANAPPARPPRTEATKTCSGAWHSGYPWCKWY